MKRNLERLRKKLGTALLAVLLFAIVTVVTSPIAPAVAGAVAGAGTASGAPAMGSTITVWPNGVNDTSDLQAAFDDCSMMMSHCTVQLEKGTYYTDQLVAYGFRGMFVGMGAGLTKIQALPDLPSPAAAYNSTASPFYNGLPSSGNPWPVLLTFINGSFTVSGMTFTEPYANPTMGYDLGGYNYTALYSMIEVDGWHAHATVDHVSIYGATGDVYGYNINTAVYFWGTFGTESFGSQTTLLGTFVVSNSYFSSVSTSVWFYNTQGKDTVSGTQTVNTIVAYGYDDVSSSVVTIRDSSATVSYGAGILAWQSLLWQATGPVKFYALGDSFDASYGANGILLFDVGTTPTLTAVASHDTVRTDTSCGCYNGSMPTSYSAIVAYHVVSASLTGNALVDPGAAGIYVGSTPALVMANKITGAYDGIWMDNASYSHVRDNKVLNSAQYGIMLVDGTSYTMVVHNLVQNSGVDDLYWDQTGTGNVWAHNMYMTSSPGGLSWGHY